VLSNVTNSKKKSQTIFYCIAKRFFIASDKYQVRDFEVFGQFNHHHLEKSFLSSGLLLDH